MTYIISGKNFSQTGKKKKITQSIDIPSPWKSFKNLEKKPRKTKTNKGETRKNKKKREETRRSGKKQGESTRNMN